MSAQIESLVPAAPVGGRIHALQIAVNPGRAWEDAVSAISPRPQSNEVMGLGQKYPEQVDTTLGNREVILVNFGKEIPTGNIALDWAKSHGLLLANPRVAFALGECKPHLPAEIGLEHMALVSTESCSFHNLDQVCCVWWQGSARAAFVVELGHVWNANSWFAFESPRQVA